MLEEEKKMTRTGDTTSNKAPPQTGEIKGPSHPKKGTAKGRNGKDLTETEALKGGGKNIHGRGAIQKGS